jgi:Tfp pilus assembly protein PilF
VCAAAAILCAAVAVATAALRADQRLRLPQKPARALAVGTGLVVLALAISVGPRLVDSAIDKLKVKPQAARSSDPAVRLTKLSSARYGLWSAALDVHAAQPLHGTGAGTFEFEWNRSPHYVGFVRDAHSFYLESLAEQGWLGFTAALILLGGLLGVAVIFSIRERGDPAKAGFRGVLLAGFVIFLAYAGFDWMWEETAVAVFGLAAASIAIGSTSEPREAPPRVWVRVLAAFVALAIGLTQLPGLVSTAQIRSSQTAAQRGDLAAAEVDAGDAVASAPWAASPYVQRALLFERAGRLTDARADILRAMKREPTNYRHPLLLARIEALRGRVRQALLAFRSARRLAPRKIIEAGGPKVTSPDDGP